MPKFQNQNGKITDLVSFYSLPSSVMGHTTHKTIFAAYLYYYVAGSVSVKQLINDALILANQEKFDVFNALDLMHNEKVFVDLKFGKGDGNLQYYLYNWKCADMNANQIGLGIFQAAFTAGIVIPKPVSVCRYWHRSLNPRKLIDVRFSHLSNKMTMARTIKLYKLPDAPATKNIREMQAKDVPQVFRLLTNSLKQYSLAPVFTSEEEVAHALLPVKNVVYSYIAESFYL
uniref:Glycylpeptide N-tetradecanoyltransferase n=1 Tax=Caenorhabditis japonica TaxID=281687 RepID=A0A8R1E0Z0_CAEJA